MRFFIPLAALAVFTVVSAQNSTTPSQTTTSSTPQQTCLAACGYGDICCQAACVNVPCPNQAAANATTECAAKCPQGNGTQQDTQRYAMCQSGCISSYFLATTSTRAGAATAVTSSGSMTVTSSGMVSSSTSSRSGSATGSTSASTTASGNAAAGTRTAIAGAGLLGLIIAGLAI